MTGVILLGIAPGFAILRKTNCGVRTLSSGPQGSAITGRCGPQMSAEAGRQVLLAGKPGHQGNLCDGQAAVTKQVPGAMQSPFLNKTMWRFSRGSLEGSRKMILAEARDGGEFVQGNPLLQLVFNGVQYALKTPGRQCRRCVNFLG